MPPFLSQTGAIGVATGLVLAVVSVGLARLTEAELQVAVDAALAATPEAENARVLVNGRQVRLIGDVADDAAREAIIGAAREAAGPGDWIRRGVRAVDAGSLRSVARDRPVEPCPDETREDGMRISGLQGGLSTDNSPAAGAAPPSEALQEAKALIVDGGTADMTAGADVEGEPAQTDDRQTPSLKPAPDYAAIAASCAAELASAGDVSQVRFLQGSTRPMPSSVRYLEAAARALRRCGPVRVIVVGHTDATGAEPANQLISGARADNIRNILIGFGVGQARLSALGRGSADPIGDDTTAAGRAMNRRIAFDVGPYLDVERKADE